MQYYANNSEEIAMFAHALNDVPGLVRLFWHAASLLCDARNAIKEVHEYEETHRSKGKAYTSLCKRQSGAQEAFLATVDSLDILLEAYGMDEPHTIILEEVSILAESVGWKDCYFHARGC